MIAPESFMPLRAPRSTQSDAGGAGATAVAIPARDRRTAFVESCVETIADSAVAAEQHSRGRPKARRLIRLLSDKHNILITSHRSPDPDALASVMAMARLLEIKLPDAKITMSVRGRTGGGINDSFAKLANVKLTPWDDASLPGYDAIILLDCQPISAYRPLAVIDHHRTRGKRPTWPFSDIRTEVGAATSIVFNYFMDLEVPIHPDLAAAMLFAIESDLAGAAGTPGELDNLALSSLTLLANTRKLYQMRYVDLPQSYYVAFASALKNAVYYETAMMSHLESIDALEQPAVMADLLLRFDKVQASLVTAVDENKLLISLRTSSPRISAADMARRLLRHIGEGGGHRTKAGGYIALETGTPTEIERKRNVLRRRYLRCLRIRQSRGLRLVPNL
jgi:nanoRNase/pAp phosphatase (c-di-AMP/oligoRNAs hydrolase)